MSEVDEAIAALERHRDDLHMLTAQHGRYQAVNKQLERDRAGLAKELQDVLADRDRAVREAYERGAQEAYRFKRDLQIARDMEAQLQAAHKELASQLDQANAKIERLERSLADHGGRTPAIAG